MAGRNNAPKKPEQAKVAPPTRPVRSVVPQTPAAAQVPGLPPGMDPRMVQQNLQKLAQNPDAMNTLRQMFGGAPAAGGDPGFSGLEPLYGAMANSIATISRANDRTVKDLDEARAEIKALKADAEAWKKQEEAKQFAQATDHAAKLKVQTALDKIIGMAHEKGGNETLSEAMIELAQTAGLPLTPEQIDTLSGAKPTDPKNEAKT